MIAILALIASVIAEAFATYTLAELFAAGYDTGKQEAPGAWAFIVCALAALAVPRISELFGLQRRAYLVFMSASAYVVLYGLLRITIAGDIAIWDFRWFHSFVSEKPGAAETGGRSLFAIVLLVALWVRTSWRSAQGVELEWIPRSTTIPFAVVTIIAVLGAGTDRSGIIARAAVGFYAFAVLALACSQLARSGATMGDMRAGGVTGTLLGGTIIATVVCVAVFGVLFGIIGPIIGPPVGVIVEVVLTILLTPPIWLLEKFFSAIFAGASPFPDLTQRLSEETGRARDPEQESSGSPWSRMAIYALRGFVLLVVIGLIWAAIVSVARLRQRKGFAHSTDGAASTSGSLAADLREALRNLIPHRSPRVARTGISSLYAEVLARAAEAGRPREPGTTPGEFEPVLEETFHAPVTATITHVFEEARYGGREPPGEQLERLQRDWRLVP